MSTLEALAKWQEYRNQVNPIRSELDHALIHELFHILQPAVMSGEIPLELL